MTRPDPAGVGTAESIAREIVAEVAHRFAFGTSGGRLFLKDAIASAITASRRQAKEEDAKIADAERLLALSNHQPPAQGPVEWVAEGRVSASEHIAATIRKTIDA